MELDSKNCFIDMNEVPFCNIKHYLESFKFRNLEILKFHISNDIRLKVLNSEDILDLLLPINFYHLEEILELFRKD